MEERRHNRRSEMVSKLILSRLDDSSAKTVDIVVNDVSMTGVGFECKEPLMIGAIYHCDLTIWTKDTIHAIVEIVRIAKEGDSYNYGAIFVGMSEMDASRIGVYQTFEEHPDA